MAFTVDHINTPAIIPIPGGLKPGKQILIRGKVANTHNSFAINVRDDQDGGNISFHFNPRQDEAVVVRNTCTGGNWGSEEKDEPYYPFSPETSFFLRIDISDNEFQTYVQGKHFINYVHRIDPYQGRFLQLTEGIEYEEVTIRDNFTVPYCREIPGGMQIGKAIRVRGTWCGSNGFDMNFSCDRQNERTAFHFKSRPEENNIVMNSNLDEWGDEETNFHEDFPFGPGRYFDILFVGTGDKYCVFVNDVKFADFSHRCSIPDATHLNIKGDVDIADIQVLEPVDDDYIKEIQGGICEGDVIRLRGCSKSDADSFVINFLEGLSTDSDIALHCNPRLDEDEIVFNTKKDDSWEDEERADITASMAKKEPFDIRIDVKSKKFKVFVDGSKVEKFKARSPMENIKAVYVGSGVHMFEVKVQKKMEPPLIKKIPGGVQPGRWIIVLCKPWKDCNRFHINFRCGEDTDGDIAFHYNPRFGEEQYTVRNAHVDGEWGGEDTEDIFPYQQKKYFEVIFRVTEEMFVVYVNGQFHVDFHHRLSLDRINQLELEGDANFYEIEFL